MMGWIVAGAVAITLAFLFSYPSWQRWETRRKREKDPRYTTPRIMGIVDELYHPDAHAARQIAEDQREVPAEAPVPGDKP